jgi:hypothetical protein
MLEQLESAPNVKVRDRAVIARVLRESGVENDIEVAVKIIEAQVAAGLGTFILEDLQAFVREARA